MSEHPAAGVPDERAGVVFAASAYVLWGVLPLYWYLLTAVPPLQITASRVLFCAATVAGISLARGRRSRIITILTTPALIRNLVASALLIGCNWTIFVYGVATNRLVEASLGYYILPLVSAGLGVMLLSERLSAFRIAALVLAGAAVSVQAVALGYVPWIALSLAVSFGFYGYFRKLTPVDPLDGLMIEMLVLLPLTLGLCLYWWAAGRFAFFDGTVWRGFLLALAGPVTALPLSLFAAGARRIRLTTLGFLQYLGPSITLVLATALLGESFTRLDAATFACVWMALAIVAAEGRLGRLRLRSAAGK